MFVLVDSKEIPGSNVVLKTLHMIPKVNVTVMITMLSNYMILITMPTNVYVTMSTMMTELVTVNTLIVGMM